MTLSTPYALLGSAFTVIGNVNEAPVSKPTTVMLVDVWVNIDLAITFTDLEVIVILLFLSASFKNTGVVALGAKKSGSIVPSGSNPLSLRSIESVESSTSPPPLLAITGVMLAIDASCNINVYALSTPFLVFGVIVWVIPGPLKLNDAFGNGGINGYYWLSI